MTGFEAWLQGERLIHCLEGGSAQRIFSGLRDQIAHKNPIALKLQAFYQEVLGKDYSLPSVTPTIECLADLTRPGGATQLKRGRCFPLLADKVEAHRAFSAAGDREWLEPFGITRYTQWLQKSDEGHFLIVYTEHDRLLGPDRLKEAGAYPAWRRASSLFSHHTGLPEDQLSPDIEWLTAFHP
ncbi:MAG: hypothetical protein AB7O90_19725 [Hyphomicrobium sp.]